MVMNKSGLQGLYVITAGQQGDLLLQQVEAALQGGAKILQYRDKTQNKQRRYEEATALNILCQTYQIPLIINDDVELAKAVKAAGVHLGQEDGDLLAIRAEMGPEFIIGRTCHNQIALAKEAQQQGASYVAFGACFPSLSKPTASQVSLETLQQARQLLQIPIAAIGGITLQNVQTILQCKVDMIAIIHDLFSAACIKSQAQAYSSALQSRL